MDNQQNKLYFGLQIFGNSVLKGDNFNASKKSPLGTFLWRGKQHELSSHHTSKS